MDFQIEKSPNLSAIPTPNIFEKNPDALKAPSPLQITKILRKTKSEKYAANLYLTTKKIKKFTNHVQNDDYLGYAAALAFATSQNL